MWVARELEKKSNTKEINPIRWDILLLSNYLNRESILQPSTNCLAKLDFTTTMIYLHIVQCNMVLKYIIYGFKGRQCDKLSFRIFNHVVNCG